MEAAVYSKQYINISVHYKKNHLYLVLSSSISVFLEEACTDRDVNLPKNIKSKHLILWNVSLPTVMKTKVLDSWLKIFSHMRSSVSLNSVYSYRSFNRFGSAIFHRHQDYFIMVAVL